MTRAYVCVKISEYTPSWDWTCLHVYKMSRVTLEFDHGKQLKNYQGGTTIPDLPTKYATQNTEPFRGKWRYSSNQAMIKVKFLT